MKRILSLILVLGLVFGLSACGKKEDKAQEEFVDKGRELYNVNLENYVGLGKYIGLSLDLNSEEFKQGYENMLLDDVINNGYHKEEQLKTGTVKNGDIANINYVGKKDGVAFEGGTADNYDLTIGSNSFIDGFEEGLIGVEIGSTVDLNLTFPEEYQSAELAGKAVVFTVKVNYVKSAMTPEEYFEKTGYETVEGYYAYVEKTVAKEMLLDMVVNSSEVNKYPEKDKEFLLSKEVEVYENYAQSNYGMSLENLLASSGQTLEDFKKNLFDGEVKAEMDGQMVIYAIFDKEKLSFSNADINRLVKDVVEAINNNPDDTGSKVNSKEVLEYYGEYYFEYQVVCEKVADFVYNNAKISE